MLCSSGGRDELLDVASGKACAGGVVSDTDKAHVASGRIVLGKISS